MIYIAINVLFNAFLMGIIFTMGSSILHVKPMVAWCLAYVISGGLTLIGYTRFGTWAVSLFMPGRQMIGRERAKLEPLLQDVIDNTNREYGTHYRLSDFKIRVTDNKVVNAFAIGYSTITVNRGAFDAFSDSELRAILAHEMGHLYYRDSVRSIALIFSSFATRIIMTVYGIYLTISALFSQAARGEVGGIVALFSWLSIFMFLPIIVLNWIGTKVFTLLNMKMSRGAEYRADAFAASLGYKADMIAALEVLDQITVYDNSFIAKLMATHPSTMSRIGALEDGVIAKQKIGSLFVATPFAANNNVQLGCSGEVIRLATVLGIAGILWGAYGVYGLHINQPPSKAQVTPAAQRIAKCKQTGCKIVQVIQVQQINNKKYSITYKLPNGSTKTIYKHVAPANETMTLDELNKLP